MMQQPVILAGVLVAQDIAQNKNYLQVEDLWTKNMFDLGEGTEAAQLCD